MPNNTLDRSPTTYDRIPRRPDRAAAPSSDQHPEPTARAGTRRGARRGLAGLLALGVLLTAAACALGIRAWQVGSALGSALFPVDDIVELAAVAVGTVAAGRVGLHALVALACVLVDRRGRRWATGERAVARHAPAMVRRLARAAAGAGVGLALTVPTATALSERGSDVPPSDDVGPAVVLDLGWQPTDGARSRTAEGADRSASPRPRPGPERSSLVNRGLRDGTQRLPLVVVEPGDTLWALAADHLAAERAATSRAETAAWNAAPSDAEVADAVTRWHHANREVLGGNPDLIRPGTVLRRP